ncbi:AraC family transcriptional regulator [Streptomyces sp. NPDC000987]|uniref:AraC family transcriptional regulator n=1 Tax=Streptomyces sp. NPDC000987 TaxID=3154374 RepID=UPI00331F30B6
MPAGSYVVEEQTTVDVGAQDRADFWSEHIASYQSRMGYRYARLDDFHGETVRQRSDTYQLVRYRSDEIEYHRTLQQIRQDPDEDYRFLVPLSGRIVMRYDDEQAVVGPGCGTLLNFQTPFQCLQDASVRAFIFTIPAREIDGRLSRTSPMAAGVDLTKGLGRVVNSVLNDMYEERYSLTDPEFDAVADRVVDLLCMLVVGDERPEAPGHLAQVEAMVRRYARAHAADPGLTGTSMAHALGWSLRQIQLALQRAGTTPRDLIREERLRLVRDRLQCGSCAHMTITELAYATGFSSASALSTAFRRRFGVSPREMRLGPR